MKINKQEQDGEEIPIMESDSFSKKNLSDSIPSDKYLKKTIKNLKNTNKHILIILTIFFFIIIYLLFFSKNNKMNQIVSKMQKQVLDLNIKMEAMNSEITNLKRTTVKKKIGIGIVVATLYGNGIGRVITVLTELLAKTNRYEIYLINEKATSIDFPYYQDVHRVIQKKDKNEIEMFDKEKNIQIYILNNDISNFVEIYKSLGKKIIGIFHGVFLSCIFTNHTFIYSQWYRFELFDSFVQIIADDYWIYNKFNFKNVVYIPNVYTFEHTLTPSSNLTYKNVLIVGRIDDVIKGSKYGIMAMSEVVKQIPDAQLYVVSGYHDPKIVNLVKTLNIEQNVHFTSFSFNISEYYLNSSVLLVSSVSESFPMVMNEGKAHGLPVVAFNIDYSPCFQKGVITVDVFDYKAMANETVKLLNDYDYRKAKGKEAKLSLDMYKNEETIAKWEELFSSLLEGKDSYKKFQDKIKKKYYNEKIAGERIRKHYRYAQIFNKFFRCHSFEQFTDLNYLKTIQPCNVNADNSTQTLS